MNLFIPLIAAAAGLSGVCLGYFLSRWQKQRELLFARKLDVYFDLVTALLELEENCAPNSLKIVGFDKFGKFMYKLRQAGLFMPNTLYLDLHATTHATIDRIGATREVLDFVSDVFNQAPGAEERFYALKEAFKGEGKERFRGKVFEPLMSRVPDIIRMLKTDLGIEQIGGSFYKREKRK